MRWIVSCSELLAMAARAFRRESGVDTLRVTGLATHIRVDSRQRKARGFMAQRELPLIFPTMRSMTGGAVVVKLSAMNIRVALDTICRSFCKAQRRVTSNAGDSCVTTDQRKFAVAIVIENRIGTQIAPAFGCMAVAAIKGHRPVWTFHRARSCETQNDDCAAEKPDLM